MYYAATVTDGKETYHFEINKAKNYFAMYLIDEHYRRLEISTILGSVEMIADEEAFRRTEISKDRFTITRWATDKNGKSFLV